jgi:UDP-sugar transporter A1/2/3
MSGASSLSEYGKQLGAFSILVIVQSFAILLFKLCQVGGKYTFNPASSVALTEVCKLGLAGTLHYRYTVSERKPFFEHVNLKIVLHYFGLSALYTVNNQLSFYCLEVADPGSMALGKSIAPYLCALLLRLAGQHLHALQWVCVVVQCCAIAIVQYDACKGTGYLPTKAYYMIGLATSITAVTSVWNQLIIKGFEVPVNLQNAIMYAFGSVIATVSYVHSAATETQGRGHGHKSHHIGFFEGYTTLAILLVLFQAFHGLAVALVYKYADAIVKNFANSSVMAILIVVSFYFFGLQTTLHSWLGIVIVLATTYCYMNIALRMPPPAPPVHPEQEKASLLAQREAEEGSAEEMQETSEPDPSSGVGRRS